MLSADPSPNASPTPDGIPDEASAASEAGSAPVAFRQRLGLFDSTMLVAGSMIGSGIFIVSADIARTVGSSGWLMAVWGVTGLMTVIGALSYAELAAMMPQAGGQYVYLREAYGRLWGFLYGWAMFLVIQTGMIAAVAVAFAKFLGVFVPALGTGHVIYRVADLHWHLELPLPWLAQPLVVFTRDEFTISAGQLVAAAVVAALSLWNCFGIEQGKWLQNIFTVAKTIGLLMLIALGFSLAANHEAIAANLRDLWSGIHATPATRAVQARFPGAGTFAPLMAAGAAMVGALFSADAWHNIAFTAGEIRNVRRTLPLSMVLGTLAVITLYLVVNLAYLTALPVTGDAQAATVMARGIAHAREDRVATAVLELAAPNFGVSFMAAAIMISTFGCANGVILMGARLYYAMAADGLFFRAVGRLNARAVPAAGLVLQGAWASLLIFSGSYSELLDYVIFAALLFYFFTVLGLFVLRFKRPDAPRPYRALGYPLLPAAYMLLCGAILLDLLLVKPVFTWPGLLIVLTGIPVYAGWRLIGRALPARPE
ncbi:MAG TPA: amino acid permease [Pirellulales bacterium]|nr:amino acid permease [Pirellulales bacterium]